MRVHIYVQKIGTIRRGHLKAALFRDSLARHKFCFKSGGLSANFAELSHRATAVHMKMKINIDV